MIKKKLGILVLLFFLTFPLISSFDLETFQSCAGDGELMIGCMGDEQFGGSFWARDYINPIITLIAPIDSQEDTDGILDFYYSVLDASSVRNCSLYLDNILWQTNTTIIKTETQHFQVRNPLIKDDLRWYISCRDLFNNIGNSTERRLDTKLGHSSPAGGGGGSFPEEKDLINVTDLDDLNVTSVPKEKIPFKVFLFPFLIIFFLIVSLSLVRSSGILNELIIQKIKKKLKEKEERREEEKI